MIYIESENKFDSTNLEVWSKYHESKEYILEDLSNGTYKVIPAVNNIEKRFMILITSIINAYYGFKSTIAQDFILELPKEFQKLLEQIY